MASKNISLSLWELVVATSLLALLPFKCLWSPFCVANCPLCFRLASSGSGSSLGTGSGSSGSSWRTIERFAARFSRDFRKGWFSSVKSGGIGMRESRSPTRAVSSVKVVTGGFLMRFFDFCMVSWWRGSAEHWGSSF